MTTKRKILAAAAAVGTAIVVYYALSFLLVYLVLDVFGISFPTASAWGLLLFFAVKLVPLICATLMGCS